MKHLKNGVVIKRKKKPISFNRLFATFIMMKTALVVLLFFMSYWGWIALGLCDVYNLLPDKWYIVLPLFLIATIYGFKMRDIARKYRDKK